MFELIDDMLMTEKQQAAVLLIYGLSSPYHLIDEQPFLSKKVWNKRFKVSPMTISSLVKRRFVEYDGKGGVRLTVVMFRNVRKKEREIIIAEQR